MDKLQLEVILSAIDRATRPLRAITKESGALAKGLRKSKDDLAALNALQQRVQGFRKLKNDADASKTALAAATQRLKAIKAATADTVEPTRQQAIELARATKALDKSRAAHVANLGALRRSREGLQAAGIAVAKLSQHEKDLAAQIAAANTRVDQQTAKMRALAEANRRVQRAQVAMQQTQQMAGDLRGIGASSMVGGAAVMSGPIAAIRAASDFEQAMLAVAKQVDGLRDANGGLTRDYNELASGIQKMSQRLPMASTEIAALVAAGARLGIQGRQNLLLFAETAATSAGAFDLPAEQIGEDMARIANLYKIPIRNIGQLGDALNWLDNNAQANGADIINVLQRVGDVADRMDFRKAAAFGSTFLSLGAAPEVAASATKALVRELSIATQQPKKFQGAMRQIGLDSVSVQKRMATDAAGTIMDVLQRINAAAPDQRISLATQIFGKEFGDDAGKLALNLGELRKQIALTTDPKAIGSMDQENKIRLQAMAQRWAMLKNQLFNTSVTVGTALAPTLITLMEVTGRVLTRVQDWVTENPELAAGLAKAALFGGALLAVLGGMSIGVSALMGPLSVLRYGITMLGVRFGPLMRNIVPLARNALPMLMHGFRLLLPLVAGISAPVWLVIGAVALLAGVIYKYWTPIKAFLSGFFDGMKQSLAPVMGELMTALEPLRPVLDAVSAALSDVWTWITELFTPVNSTSEELKNAEGYGRTFANVLSIFVVPAVRGAVAVVGIIARVLRVAFAWSPLGLIVNNWEAIKGFYTRVADKMRTIGGQIMDGLRAGIEFAMGPVLAVIKRVGNMLPDGLRSKLGIKSPSRVFIGIGQHTMSGLALGISGNASLPVRAIDALQGRVRAAGDALARGRARTGAAPGVAPAGAGRGQGGGNSYVFHINAPGGDPDAIKRAVREALAEAERTRQARSRSALADSGD